MTTTPLTRDPVQGLVDYVLDVKPFHTKILEVWVHYIHTDLINATVKDRLAWEIFIDLERLTGCKYGWDTSPWDMFWNVEDQSQIVTGTFRYTDGSSTILQIPKFDAYRLFFDYLTAQWQSRFGNVLPPVFGDISASNPFRILFLPLTTGKQVITECFKYWETEVLSKISAHSSFWLDTRTKRLYQQKNDSWVEQLNCYYSQAEPVDPVVGDFWYSTSVAKLYVRVIENAVDHWVAIASTNIHVGYEAPAISVNPKSPPVYPELWKSNWDYPLCNAPGGENHVFAYVNDILMFEHGSEIFLFDHVRTAVVDPTGRDLTASEYTTHTQRIEHPIKWRTKVIQTSRNRYKLQREEISVITEPNNPEIKNTTWTIDLNGFDFEGWDIERVRKDVKLGSFLTWKYTTGGTKLIEDNLINQQAFRFRVANGNLIAQQTTQTGVTDIPCPWVAGTVVYVRSTDDLPKYNLPTLDAYKSLRLERYRPYRVVLKTGNQFSLAIADRETLEVDESAMGTTSSLTFLDNGSGRKYIGIGYPVPFMEIKQNFNDSIRGNQVGERLASPDEIFVDFVPSQIVGARMSSLVVAGDFSAYSAGSEIQIGGSADNNGLWTVSDVETHTNVFESFDDDGNPTPSVAPEWWDVETMGDWPQPIKKSQSEIDGMVVSGDYAGHASEYIYSTFTLISVEGSLAGLTAPYGFVAETSYNLDEGSGENSARATITENIQFKLI